jgi:hypothetical protein
MPIVCSIRIVLDAAVIGVMANSVAVCLKVPVARIEGVEFGMRGLFQREKQCGLGCGDWTNIGGLFSMGLVLCFSVPRLLGGLVSVL